MLHDILHESRKLRVKRAEAILRRIDRGQIKEAAGKQGFGAWLFGGVKRRFGKPKPSGLNLNPKQIQPLWTTENGVRKYSAPFEVTLNGQRYTVNSMKYTRDTNNARIVELGVTNGAQNSTIQLTRDDYIKSVLPEANAAYMDMMKPTINQTFNTIHNTAYRQGIDAGYAAGRAGRKHLAAAAGILGLGGGGTATAFLSGGGSTQLVPVPQTLPPGMSEEEFARLLEAHNANGNLPGGTPGGTTNNTQGNKGSIVPWLLGLTAIGGLGLGAYSLMNSKGNSSKPITDVRDMEQELEAERERRRRRKQLAAYTAANTSVEDRKMLPAPEPKEEVTYAF